MLKARTRPELTGLATTFRANTQQLRADVNRDKATLLGVPIQDVYSAIQAQFGSLDREPIQRVQPRLVGGAAVRCALSCRPPRTSRVCTPVRTRATMVPLSALVTTTLGVGP